MVVLAVFLVKYAQAANEKEFDYAPPEERILLYSAGAVIKPNFIWVPSDPVDTNHCSCVKYLQDKYPDDPRIRGYGTAGNIPIESIEPFSHGFVVTYESDAGHLAEYLRNGDNIEVLDEANFERCEKGSGRIVPWNMIKGFIEL